MLAFCVCTPPDADIVTARAPTSPTSATALKTRSFTVSSSLGLVATGDCVDLFLRLPPSRAVGERELRQRLGPDLDAATGRRRSEVAPADDLDRVDEVLVQVV